MRRALLPLLLTFAVVCAGVRRFQLDRLIAHGQRGGILSCLLGRDARALAAASKGTFIQLALYSEALTCDLSAVSLTRRAIASVARPVSGLFLPADVETVAEIQVRPSATWCARAPCGRPLTPRG